MNHGRGLAELQAYVDGCSELRTALGMGAQDRPLLREFACGEYNANYAFEVAGRTVLLRVNLGSQMHLIDQIGYEARALRFLEPSGRTPRVLFVDSAQGCLVEEWLPGRPLDYASDLPEVARILADIHAVPVPTEAGLVAPPDPLGAVLDECSAMFEVYRTWNGSSMAVVDAVNRLFWGVQACVGRARGVVHGKRHIVNTELNAGNFLINDPGCPGYLVDWEKPVLGEVAQDLGHLLAPTTTLWRTSTVLDQDRIARFIEEYIEAVDGRFATEGLAERVGVYGAATCLRGVTWCAMAYSQYVDDGRVFTRAESFAKIASYLEPAFIDGLRIEWCGGLHG